MAESKDIKEEEGLRDKTEWLMVDDDDDDDDDSATWEVKGEE